MKQIVWSTFVFTLSACGMANPDVAMKIEKSTTGYDLLIGEFDGSLALIHGDPTNANIHVTDGRLTCDGISTTGKFSTNMITNKISHLFNFTCNDGRTGKAPLKISMKADLNAHGIGVGTMSDGSRMEVIVGQISRTVSQFNTSIASQVTPPVAATLRPTATIALPTAPINVRFRSSKTRPDDVAVIIGNADYTQGKDIPNVAPAYADAEGMKRYVKQALGVADDNIIFLKDATQKDMISTFGSVTNHKGRLFRYLAPGKSRVFVYYAGHGAPGEGDSNYLVPTDAEASLIDLNGYPIKTLYKNLSKLPAKSVTVVLEACFSGTSQGGSLIQRSSGITVVPKASAVPSNITVISAGTASQIASWEEDKSHSLFTKYFLKGMSGEADANKDSKVSWAELKGYLTKTVTRFALRYYGREQTVQIVGGG